MAAGQLILCHGLSRRAAASHLVCVVVVIETIG